jgi:hypothetical protein
VQWPHRPITTISAYLYRFCFFGIIFAIPQN